MYIVICFDEMISYLVINNIISHLIPLEHKFCGYIILKTIKY